MADPTPHDMDEISHLRALLLERDRRVESLEKVNSEQCITIDNLRNSLKSTRQSPSDVPELSLLKMLPIEIRRMIYKLLLVSPELSNPKILGAGEGRGTQFQFDLCPSFLRTCQQVYKEASTVLYGSNTFVMICEQGKNGPGALPLSPLTRHLVNKKVADFEWFDFRTIPVLSKIKHWRVVVIQYKNLGPKSPNNFIFFCRAIALSPPKSLHVLVALGTGPTADIHYNSESLLMDTSLDMKQLRNIKGVKLGVASGEDLSISAEGRIVLWKEAPECIAREFEEECQEIIESDEPCERIYEMYGGLLDYARCFERDEIFRNDLGSVYSHSPASKNNPFKYNPDISRRNGMKYKHTVEDCLAKASSSSYQLDHDAFQEARNKSIQYLDDQFKLITEKMADLKTWIEKENSGYGLFKTDYTNIENEEGSRWHIAIYLNAITLFEDCCKAFDRKLDNRTRIIIFQNATRFDDAYNELLRERTMRKMKNALKREGYQEVLECFKIVADDMYSQYLQICKARKNIFASDISPETGCDVDITKGICEEPLDWGKE